MTCRSSLPEITAYITKDGSEIRELLHPNQHAVKNQSLAEARIPPGTRTIRHLHNLTEEIYHITQGSGRMQLGEESFMVCVGDSIAIAPGTPHCIENTGQETLQILCCCAPAYSHEDTVLLED
jgi:mannose-6-phosphate isomerase-like protein (cupin superfamily)